MTIKSWLLAGLALLGFVGGFVAQYFYPQQMFPASDIPVTLIGVTLSFLWYYADTEESGYRRRPLLNAAIIAIGIAAFPYYFFSSRGFRMGLACCVGFMMVVIVWYALNYLGMNAASVISRA